jgi:hypothetical protein
VKIKKYVNPKIKAQALAKAITRLGDAAERKAKASQELKEETEAVLKQMGKIGLDGRTATTIVAAVCSPLFTCTRCGLDKLERDMSGDHCLECAVALTREQERKQFS